MESLAFLNSNDTLSFVKRNTNTCTTFLQHSGYLNNFQMILLSVFNAVTMVGNLLANLTVILCLIKTEQIKNMSCKLVFQLSLSNALVATITQPLVLVDIVRGNSFCEVKILSQCSTFFARVPIYTINLIGYDRYLRVRYPVTHQERLSPFRVYMMLLLIWVVALLSTLSMPVGFLIKLDTVRGISGFIDFSMVLVVIFFQMKTIWATHTHRISPENPSILEETQKRIVKLIARIVVMFIITVLPFFILKLLKSIIMNKLKETSKGYLEFAFQFSLNVAFMNALGNAILFLMSNQKAKRYLKRLVRMDVDHRVRATNLQKETKIVKVASTSN